MSDYQYPTEVHDDVLGYDANHNDRSQYCPHGTFIGSWWGPDYLCGACELGEPVMTPEEQARIEHRANLRRAAEEVRTFDRIVGICQQHMAPGYFGRVAESHREVATVPDHHWPGLAWAAEHLDEVYEEINNG